MFADPSGADHPGVGLRGGGLLGAPAIATRNAPEGTLSLIDPDRIAFGGGGADVRVSRQASIEMLDEPTASIHDG